MTAHSALLRIRTVRQEARRLFPGLVVVLLVGLAAKFLSEHYATPAMLLALLLGIAVSFLSEDDKTAPGIGFAAQALLRLGVALLGARISLDLLLGLGGPMIALVASGVLACIGFGLVLGPRLGHSLRFSLLTAGSVAICGASAAMAIAAVLPRDPRSEQRLIFTVVGVTVLSTVAMILYPILVDLFGLTTTVAGVFLGGTIHDVAQVVGAGFSVSEQTGDSATLVKLIRVAMLAPVVLGISLVVRRTQSAGQDGKRPPLLPGFVVGFLVLAALNSSHAIPADLADLLGQASRWLLLIAIAAVGAKTNLREVLSVGGGAITLIVLETVFLAGFILAGIMLLG